MPTLFTFSRLLMPLPACEERGDPLPTYQPLPFSFLAPSINQHQPRYHYLYHYHHLSFPLASNISFSFLPSHPLPCDSGNSLYQKGGKGERRRRRIRRREGRRRPHEKRRRRGCVVWPSLLLLLLLFLRVCSPVLCPELALHVRTKEGTAPPLAVFPILYMWSSIVAVAPAALATYWHVRRTVLPSPPASSAASIPIHLAPMEPFPVSSTSFSPFRRRRIRRLAQKKIRF